MPSSVAVSPARRRNPVGMDLEVGAGLLDALAQGVVAHTGSCVDAGADCLDGCHAFAAGEPLDEGDAQLPLRPVERAAG